MADIQTYINNILNAVYGEEVRASLVNALEKINADNEKYLTIKQEVVAAKDTVVDQVIAFDAKHNNALQTVMDLLQVTSDAVTIQRNLLAVMNAADQKRGELDKTLNDAVSKIADVAKIQNELNTVITTAMQTKNSLDMSNTGAAQTKNDLDVAIKTANLIADELKKTLTNIDTTAKEQLSAIQSAGTTGIEKVTDAGSSQIAAVQNAGTQAVADIDSAKTDAVTAVTEEGNIQTKRVQDAAAEIIADREQIAVLQQGKADAIVNTAQGERITLPDSSNKLFRGLRVFGKSTQDGTPSVENPVPIVSVGDKGNIIVTVESETSPQSLILQTPDGLPGVKVDSDGNYTDKDGQQWVCDEIDLERGKYVQRVAKYIFDGTETGLDDWLPTIVVYMRSYGLTGTNKGKKLSNYGEITFSNKTGRSFGFSTTKWGISNAEELETFLKNKFDSKKPVIVQYILAIPIEHDLTPEELAAYKALHSNYPTTMISNDESAHMEVSYVADTKNYIAKTQEPLKKQITDLQNALISQKIVGGGYKSS